MPKINPYFIKHELNVLPDARVLKQREMRFVIENIDLVIEEMEKLKEASAITKVLHLSYLSNTVVVKRKTGKWKVCEDFTSLNRACPKD